MRMAMFMMCMSMVMPSHPAPIKLIPRSVAALIISFIAAHHPPILKELIIVPPIPLEDIPPDIIGLDSAVHAIMWDVVGIIHMIVKLE